MNKTVIQNHRLISPQFSFCKQRPSHASKWRITYRQPTNNILHFCIRQPFYKSPFFLLDVFVKRFVKYRHLKYMPSSSSAGEVPSVLASRAFSQVPVLRGGSNGWVQHAPVHPQRVQSHRCQGMLIPLCACVNICGYVLVCEGMGKGCEDWLAFYTNTTIQPKSILILGFHTNADSRAKC